MRKGIKRIVFGAASLLPATALAQNVPTGDVNTNLDPSAAPGSSKPAPASTGANGGRTAIPAGGSTQPNVIVVGPDGKITSTNQQEPAENGYYISGGNQPLPTADSADLHAGPIPELHVVRTGDTLWDISAFYFANPWEWPKVWSYNPQITNPHWIYPGDLVRLLPRGMFVSSNPEPEGEQQQAPQKQPDVLPAPAKRTDVGIKQTAFVEKKDLDDSVVIDGSVDEKVLLGDGDSVYLSYPDKKPPTVGKRYSIYIPGKQVTDGTSNFGSYVKVIGTVEVVSVKENKRARGVIVQANQEIERGAKVGPLVKQFKNVPAVQPKVDAQGPIIGMLTRDQLIGDGEVVFVALGKNNGLEVGNRMYVVRRGDGRPDVMAKDIGKDDRRFPARALGEVVIVEVGEKVSIGLVTLSVQEMSVGDLVMMQAAK